MIFGKRQRFHKSRKAKMKTQIAKACLAACVLLLLFIRDAFAQSTLNISLSGTNVQLQWSATNPCVVETTTNLAADQWCAPTGFTPVQIGPAEFVLTCPMDAPNRFFRLASVDAANLGPILSVSPAALMF